MAYFICPNCRDRSIDADGIAGISHQKVGCARCGFGFLFELLDDYYPHPDAGLVACDAEARILACGRGTFELSGLRETDVIGRDIVEAFGIVGGADGDPIAVAREWGVRQLSKPGTIRHAAGHDKPVTLDVFPALDDDGGLLVAFAPR